MSNILLTQNTGRILGPVAKLLGYTMEGIFYVIDKIGIPNIGLAIILFTIVIYLLLMPLTIKQQKFSKLSAKMNPELQEIQKKYKGKKDNDSMMAMNMETKAVYAKYGVSPSGSCVQLLIQMPILLALYRVIGNIPAYVGKVKDAFFPLVDKLINEQGSVEFLQTFANANMYQKQFENENFVGGVTSYVQNTFVDVLNTASSAEWVSLKEHFSNLSADIDHTLSLLDQYNNFLGLSMSNSPAFTFSEARAAGSVLMMIAAFAIPVLAAVTQWINVKLMPQQDTNTGNEQQNTMAQSMKTMNMIMPVMSAVFCYTLPAGMGLYWVAGAVIRSIQQVLINKHIDKMDIEEVILKNQEKAKKKMEKAKEQAKQMSSYANMNTRNVSMASKASVSSAMSQEEKEEAYRRSTEYSAKNAKPGSMMSKANMVKEYNEKNNK